MGQRRALVIAGALTALVVAAVLGTGARLGAFGLGDDDDRGRAAARQEQPASGTGRDLVQQAAEATVLPAATAAPAVDQAFAGVGLNDPRFAEAIGATPAPIVEDTVPAADDYAYYDDDDDDDGAAYASYDDDDEDEREEHRGRVSRDSREGERGERGQLADRQSSSSGGERLGSRRTERDHDDDD